MEVEWVPLNVLELSIILEIHPTCVRLGHVDRFFGHVLQVDDAWLHDLLGLEHVLLVVCGGVLSSWARAVKLSD